MTPAIKRIVFAFCLVKLGLHIIADFNTGFQGDELLHIATGNHLDFGYMEFPPLIGLLAFFQNLPGSQHVFLHHIFPHIASILILILASKITVELGGKVRAVFLVLLCVLIAPAFGRSQQLFQPVVFSQLFWIWSFYALLKYVKYHNRKDLWLLTFSCALAFLTKYDAVFFIFGLSALFFFHSSRRALLEHKFWQHILVFVLIISPNILWQVLHGFPAIQMFDRLYETQLNHLTPTGVMEDMLISLNPLIFLLILPGILSVFVYAGKTHSDGMHRVLWTSILISSVFLAMSQGKAYYFYPIVLTILPFGGVFWERIMLNGRRWLFYPVSVILFSGIILIPFGLPVFPLESHLEHEYPYEDRPDVPGGQYNVNFEERYSKEQWEVTLRELKSVYDSLPGEEKAHALIWGKHYSQAGAVNLFGKGYALPEAFSLHGSFYLWLPQGNMPETTIALSYTVGDFFEPYFEEVVEVRRIYNPYAEETSELYQHIYICKNPRQSFDVLKVRFKDRVFE